MRFVVTEYSSDEVVTSHFEAANITEVYKHVLISTGMVYNLLYDGIEEQIRDLRGDVAKLKRVAVIANSFPQEDIWSGQRTRANIRDHVIRMEPDQIRELFDYFFIGGEGRQWSKSKEDWTTIRVEEYQLPTFAKIIF